LFHEDCSPKLSQPVSGPYVVTGIDATRHTFLLQTPQGEKRFASDNIIRCPDVRESDPGYSESDEEEQASDVQEFVVDRVVAHGTGDDGKTLVRVRWAGFDSRDDTWEQVENIPKEFVTRYARRKRIPVSDLVTDRNHSR
jgi:hypothetical protein